MSVLADSLELHERPERRGSIADALSSDGLRVVSVARVCASRLESLAAIPVDGLKPRARSRMIARGHGKVVEALERLLAAEAHVNDIRAEQDRLHHEAQLRAAGLALPSGPEKGEDGGGGGEGRKSPSGDAESDDGSVRDGKGAMPTADELRAASEHAHAMVLELVRMLEKDPRAIDDLIATKARRSSIAASGGRGGGSGALASARSYATDSTSRMPSARESIEEHQPGLKDMGDALLTTIEFITEAMLSPDDMMALRASDQDETRDRVQRAKKKREIVGQELKRQQRERADELSRLRATVARNEDELASLRDLESSQLTLLRASVDETHSYLRRSHVAGLEEASTEHKGVETKLVETHETNWTEEEKLLKQKRRALVESSMHKSKYDAEMKEKQSEIDSLEAEIRWQTETIAKVESYLKEVDADRERREVTRRLLAKDHYERTTKRRIVLWMCAAKLLAILRRKRLVLKALKKGKKKGGKKKKK